MQVTLRELATAAHGLLFGGFFLFAIFGVLVELVRSAHVKGASDLTARGCSLARVYMIATAGLGWAAVLLGAYAVYPWYRAIPPAGAADLSLYPQRLLLASATTSGWHSLGMEWKEHVAWFAPIVMTMAAYVVAKYQGSLRTHPQVKRGLILFTTTALLAAGVAGFFGAMLDKAAPIKGGGTITLMRSAK